MKNLWFSLPARPPQLQASKGSLPGSRAIIGLKNFFGSKQGKQQPPGKGGKVQQELSVEQDPVLQILNEAIEEIAQIDEDARRKRDIVLASVREKSARLEEQRRTSKDDKG